MIAGERFGTVIRGKILGTARTYARGDDLSQRETVGRLSTVRGIFAEMSTATISRELRALRAAYLVYFALGIK